MDKQTAKKILKNIPHRPGTYQMLSATQEVLYVGKAKDLKKRVSSYFRGNPEQLHPRTQSFLAQVIDIHIIITANEIEALLLEFNLIKTLKPTYNILLRDDKSYPYLFLSQHPYPSLSIYRGAKKEKGFYFGPFTSGLAVHETLHLLQRVFKLRQCSDSIFKNRSRPCLQFQIGRCTAPCAGYIEATEYARNVEFIRLFLSGKSTTVVKEMMKIMKDAAQKLEFEKAAYYRNQIINLKQIQQQQYMIKQEGNIDIIVLIMRAGYIGIDVLMVRNGLVLGNKVFIDEYIELTEPQEIISSFLTQYYLYHGATNVPEKILFNIELTRNIKATITQAFSQTLTQNIKILDKTNNHTYKQWLRMALENLEYKLQQKFSIENESAIRLSQLQQEIYLVRVIERIECFDVSHHGGEATVVSCVVFSKSGLQKNEYRHYNINTVVAGDDYGALREALWRRFSKLSVDEASNTINNENQIKKAPEILIIDGGKGQLKVAQEILVQLNISEITIIAISKGEGRKWGAEKMYILKEADAVYKQSNTPPENARHCNDDKGISDSESKKTGGLNRAQILPLALSPTIFAFLLRLRDEAHRFAITAQRSKLRKKKLISPLENIAGIGKKKRDLLLRHFGGWQGIKKAEANDFAQLRGINDELARRIYEALHR